MASKIRAPKEHEYTHRARSFLFRPADFNEANGPSAIALAKSGCGPEAGLMQLADVGVMKSPADLKTSTLVLIEDIL